VMAACRPCLQLHHVVPGIAPALTRCVPHTCLQLASGDVKAASRTLSESWVGEFKEAAAKVGGSSRRGGRMSRRRWRWQ
jgi:hypothetical protein